MAILQYTHLTTNSLQTLARDKTAIFLNVDPLEQHGPHLPYGTDILQSGSLGLLLANALQRENPEWNFVFMPAIPFGCDTLKYHGSIEISQVNLRAVLYDMLKQLAKDGFKYVIAVTAHGGPRHLVVLEELSERMRWRHKVQMVSASSRLIMEILSGKYLSKIEDCLKSDPETSGTHFGDEEKKHLHGDLHGGLIETSLMLALHPEHVEPLYKTLLPANIEKIWKFNRNSGRTQGQGLGFIGAPHLAKADIGKALINVLMTELVPLLSRFLKGENVRKHFRSKFYYVPFMRTDFKWIFVVAAYAASFALAWHFMIRVMTEVTKP